MSKTFSIACKDCEKQLWIGQSKKEDFKIYSGNPEVMRNLRLFLWEHKGHNLKFDENCESEIAEYEEMEAYIKRSDIPLWHDLAGATDGPDLPEESKPGSVKAPAHYTARVPGIECIQVTQHFNFNRGNAIKYIWRAGLKGNEIEDLKKAREYIDFEIKRIGGELK